MHEETSEVGSRKRGVSLYNPSNIRISAVLQELYIPGLTAATPTIQIHFVIVPTHINKLKKNFFS